MASKVASGRWLIFRLAGDRFAVDIHHVRELVPLRDVTMTRPPEVPPEVEGVAQVRDQAIGVIDLRTTLGMPSIREATDRIISMLEQREQDHIHWLKELEASVTEQREFTLATDPHQCTFGKWYDQLRSDRAMLSQFTNDDLALTEVIERFDIPHQRIHAVAQQVAEKVGEGKAEEAQELIDRTRDTELKAMIELFGRCRDLFRELRKGLLVIVEHEDNVFGALVDSVDEVTTFRSEDIDDIPAMTTGPALVAGVAKAAEGGRMIQLLDIGAIAQQCCGTGGLECQASESQATTPEPATVAS